MISWAFSVARYLQRGGTVEAQQTTYPVLGNSYVTTVETGHHDAVVMTGHPFNENFLGSSVLSLVVQQQHTEVSVCCSRNVKVLKVLSTGIVCVVFVAEFHVDTDRSG